MSDGLPLTRVAIAFSIVAAALAFLVAFGRPASNDGVPDAYTQTVQHLIGAGGLRVGEANAGGNQPPAVQVFATSNDAKQLVRAAPFFADDMRNMSLWTVRGDRIVDFRSRRSVKGPFASRFSWKGDLLYGAGVTVDESRTLAMAPRGRRGPELRLTPGSGALRTDDGSIAKLDPSALSAATVEGPAIEMLCPDDGLVAVRVQRLGDQLVANAHPIGRSACEVEVAGRLLTENCQTSAGRVDKGACLFEALGPGEAVRIAGQQELVYQRVSDRSLGQTLSRRTFSGKRLQAPELAEFARAAERDLDMAIADCRNVDDRRCTDDITLTFDRQLQRSANAALAATMPGDIEAVATRTAALTVIDAMTGEVLAMSASAGGRTDCAVATLCLMPVGSTAKPLFAAAMITAEPSLATLRTRFARAPEHILGMPLGRPLRNAALEPGNGEVDLTGFLARSDNVYAAAMLLMASADRGDGTCPLLPGEQYSMAGRRRAERPKSIFETESCGQGRPGPFRPRWVEMVGRLFDVNEGDRGDLQENLCNRDSMILGDDYHDASVWRGLLGSSQGINPCAMLQSSPGREALRLKTASQFQGEFVSAMLGNGNGVWSSIKLAEAYARLVTGRKVVARYANANAGFPQLDRNYLTYARQPITTGLAQVLDNSLSATLLPAAVTALQTQLPADRVLGVFAKSGTMELADRDRRHCRPNAESCMGKATAVVFAVYHSTDVVRDKHGRAAAAGRRPLCAVAVVSNLQYPTPGRANAAADAVARLLEADLSRRLLPRRMGGQCD